MAESPPLAAAIDSIHNIVSVSQDLRQQLASAMQEVSLPKKGTIWKVGQKADFVVFCYQGAYRYFQILDGEEQTGQFFFEGSWFTDMNSYLSDQASQLTTEALEPLVFVKLPKARLEELYISHPALERFGRVMAEQALLGVKRKAENLAQLSPLERYTNLVKTRPQVAQRVPLKYIASYLGISAESLSRIRARLLSHP